MCIVNSVGLNGQNARADVLTVQALLNENIGKLIPMTPLTLDGRVGTRMLDLIAEFQRRVVRLGQPDRNVSPGGATMQELHAGIDATLTQDKLQAIMPQATAALASGYLEPLTTMMTKSQIGTPLRVAHFLAQIGHESGDLQYSQELADGSAYEGRLDLGNTQPGDGPKFKGRGLIQLTGRANYAAYGKARNRDFVTPQNYLAIATDKNLVVDVSCWYWTTHNLNRLADNDDLNGITKAINGGLNGLSDRAAHLQRAKCLLVR
jgi:putative chitinase